jgi:nucleoside 2-deoxyribosyltransferase
MRNLRLFIAGASSQRLAVREVIDACTALGHTVTYDWTRAPEWEQDFPLTRLQSIAAAEANMAGVRECWALIWVVDRDHPSHGAPFEAGVAWASGKPVVALWSGDLAAMDYWIYAAGAMGHAVHNVRSAIYVLSDLVLGFRPPESDFETLAEADVPGQILLAEVAL